MNINLNPLSVSSILHSTNDNGKFSLSNLDQKIYAIALVCVFALIIVGALINRCYCQKAKDQKVSDAAKTLTQDIQPTAKEPQPKREQAEQIVMDLFGGREHFEKLPVLDVGNQNREYLDLKPDELSAPIMRGRDKDGCLFFAYRAKDSNGNVYCQTCKEANTTDSAVWITTGDVLGLSGNLTEKIAQRRFPSLSEFIKTGKYAQGKRSYEMF